MEFIEITKDRYLVKDSNGRIVSEKEIKKDKKKKVKEVKHEVEPDTVEETTEPTK